MKQLKFCIITPSFKPDFERCRLLVESIDKFACLSIHHYIIVDRRDYKLFQQFEASNRTVLTVESILPWWIQKIPWLQNGWFSFKTLPIRNWLIQQIVKLEIANWIEQDVFIFVDSDVAFIRPFDHNQFIRDGKVRLFRETIPLSEWTTGISDQYKWFNTAHLLLDLPPFVDFNDQGFITNYIGNFIIWKRENVLQLHEYIQKLTDKSWIESIPNCWYFSEYTLYGVFVEQVLKENSGHYFDAQKVSHDYWGTKALSQEELQNLFQNIPPECFSVMISAKSKMSVADYASFVQ